MWVFKIPDFFFFLLSRCNFKINIFSFYHFPTDYIKSSMRLKDFGSKQCTHTVSPGDPSFLFRWQWWRFSCKQLKITDAVCEYAAPQNLSTGRTLACNKEQKKKSCWLYFPLFFQSFPVILLIKKRVDESLNPVTNEENNNKKKLVLLQRWSSTVAPATPDTCHLIVMDGWCEKKVMMVRKTWSRSGNVLFYSYFKFILIFWVICRCVTVHV